ncbi:hypothetical protein CEXT_514961 [Caerostris extrusa]|uniref:Uncharacterized protein n=1 Tax=Caerostris extrusa TaxID=172846 RepID=A0AAV4P9D5_CAEEX|nr:hypothetical protein CEXT_514961 [Caerostris extrusa]
MRVKCLEGNPDLLAARRDVTSFQNLKKKKNYPFFLLEEFLRAFVLSSCFIPSIHLRTQRTFWNRSAAILNQSNQSDKKKDFDSDDIK